MRALVWALLLGIAVGVGALFGLGALFPTTCEDGWRSPSIGIQGACSSHGGVEESTMSLRIGAAAALGLAVFGLLLMAGRRGRSASAALPASAPDPGAAVPTCPSCGAPMALRTAAGSERYRWVCTRAGEVHPTRAFEGRSAAGF